MNYDRFGYWKKKLLDSQSQVIHSEASVKPSPFVPMTIKTEKPVPLTGLCSLHLKNDRILQIDDEVFYH